MQPAAHHEPLGVAQGEDAHDDRRGQEGKPDLEKMTIEDICANLGKVPADSRAAVRNNGGGHYNHSMFWTLLAPKGSSGGGGGEPTGPLAEAIKKAFGSFADFKTKLNDAGVKRFGSGWACTMRTLLIRYPLERAPTARPPGAAYGPVWWKPYVISRQLLLKSKL